MVSREQVSSERLSESVVLVTGGTGSFGETAVIRALHGNAAEVRVFSRDELKQDLLRQKLSDARLRFYIGDTRDSSSFGNAFRGVDYVFHAAAMKQVPSGEFFPLEIVKTNVMGSANVIEESKSQGVRAVVCLSTDKAVYPINAMGMSKALMEKVAQAHSRDGSNETKIVVTRYGNVMASRGSVIPRFISQIKSGEPLTVTDPSMTRFLMTLPESMDLVEHAFTKGRQGDLLIRKSPAATIGQLAEALKLIFDSGVPVKNIGARHGEKLFESLMSSEEAAVAEDQGDYFRVPTDYRDLRYEAFFDEGGLGLSDVDAYTSHNTTLLTDEQLVKVLEQLPLVEQEQRTWKK